MAIGEAILGTVGKVADYFIDKQAANKQYKHQKEFAQQGIKWRVEDAERSGIHPLYALGAQTTSYSPVQVGSSDFGAMGQNIGRAIDSTRSNPEKADALALTASQIQLEGLQLDNEIKRAQLASAIATTRQQSNPGLPGVLTKEDLTGMPGQGNAPQVEPRTQPPQYTPYLYEGLQTPQITDRRFSDAQALEDRYGDLIQEFGGARNLIADWLLNRSAHFKHSVLPKLKIRGNKGRYQWDYKGARRQGGY